MFVQFIIQIKSTVIVVLPQELILIWLTLGQSQPNNGSLKCPSVRPCLRVYVRPSTKCFFDFTEIWHVGRGR